MAERTGYRVEYFDFEDKCWCNADLSLTPTDFATYDYAVLYRDQQREFDTKLRIVKRVISTTVVESD
jgi:hypothetical protein